MTNTEKSQLKKERRAALELRRASIPSDLPLIARLNSAPGLNYQWTISYLTPGGQAVQIFPRKVNTFWKPIFWFVKGDYTEHWIGNVVKSAVNDNDKRFHKWGQSESGIADLINRTTFPGQLICDPFVGGGTIGAVALSMNRRFIGIDIDPVAIETTSIRLRKLSESEVPK